RDLWSILIQRIQYVAVAVHARLTDLAVGNGLEDCAARFMAMTAVAKLAVADERLEFYKPLQHFIRLHMPEPEFTNPGRVNQVTAAGKMKQLGIGGGVVALLSVGQLAHTQVAIRQQRVDQRGLANPRLADKDAGKVSQVAFQFFQAEAGSGRDFDDLITQRAVGVFEVGELFPTGVINAVFLLDQQYWLDPNAGGGGQVVVDEIGVGLEVVGYDDDDTVDIGRDGLHVPMRVRATQGCLPR